MIQTTAEHPFYVRDRGWVPCHHLQVGDWLATLDGWCVPVEEVFDTGQWATLYNLRVADYHTYFVGCDEWGWAVWAHNACVYEIAEHVTGIVRYVGIAGTRQTDTLNARIAAGLITVSARLQWFNGGVAIDPVNDLDGFPIRGLGILTTEQAEAVEAELIRHHGRLILGTGTLVNILAGINSTHQSDEWRRAEAVRLLRQAGYPGY